MFYHESTKVGKHEIFFDFFRVFVISCFRDYSFSVLRLGGSGLGKQVDNSILIAQFLMTIEKIPNRELRVKQLYKLKAHSS